MNYYHLDEFDHDLKVFSYCWGSDLHMAELLSYVQAGEIYRLSTSDSVDMKHLKKILKLKMDSPLPFDYDQV